MIKIIIIKMNNYQGNGDKQNVHVYNYNHWYYLKFVFILSFCFMNKFWNSPIIPNFDFQDCNLLEPHVRIYYFLFLINNFNSLSINQPIWWSARTSIIAMFRMKIYLNKLIKKTNINKLSDQLKNNFQPH